VSVLLSFVLQYRASIQFPNAHSDGIWSTFWTSNDKILTGSVDEVAKSWYVSAWNKVEKMERRC
jgi:hypothetical protein